MGDLVEYCEETARIMTSTYNGEGTVMFKLDENSKAPFNALADNCIMVHPVAALQFVDNTWVTVPMLIYQNGVWKDPLTYLFYEGAVNTELTGGVNGTIEDDHIHFSGSIKPAYNKTYTTNAKIDVTGYSYIKAVVRSDCSDTGPYFRLLIDDTAANGSRVVTGDLVKHVMTGSPMNGAVVEIALDISDRAGEYYLGYAWCNLSSVSDTFDFDGELYRWWLE
jgi:hypothetical protein